jgi:hypothetical protein
MVMGGAPVCGEVDGYPMAGGTSSRVIYKFHSPWLCIHFYESDGCKKSKLDTNT